MASNRIGDSINSQAWTFTMAHNEYCLRQKDGASKWLVVAVWQGDDTSTLRDAEIAFTIHGYKVGNYGVARGSQLATQKNVTVSLGVRRVYVTVEEVKKYQRKGELDREWRDAFRV